MTKYLILIISLFFSLNIGASTSKQSNMDTSRDQNYILLLDFYRTTNEWANGIDDDIIKHLILKNKRFFLKNLFDATTDDNKSNSDWWRIYFSDLPNGKPRIVMILGDAGWILYRHYVPQSWKNIPCIVLPARKNIVPFDLFTNNIEISDKNQIPFKETMKGFKVIGLNHGHYAKETIQLIQKLQPDVRQILFITDSRLSSAFVKYGMEKIVKKDFKNLKYVPFERYNHTTDQLLDTLQQLDKRTGIIFYGWSSSKDKADNADYTKKIISAYSHTPVFTLSDYKTLEETSMCGGYYNSLADIANSVNDILDRFDKGLQIKWGTVCLIDHPHKYLSYLSLLDKHIDIDLIPDDAIVFGRPDSFVKKNMASLITITVICLIVFILLISYAWTQRKLNNLTKKTKIELEHLNHILQVVLEASDVLPWSMDLKKNILSINGKTLDIASELDFVHPDDRHNFTEAINYLKADHKRQGIIPHEVRINIRRTGFHWFRLRGVVDMRDENGEPICIIGSAEDIEKQKQIEANLIETKEKAIESNNLKTVFLANMSHEIRTPLNAIVGYSDLLATSENLDSEDKKIFNKNIYESKEQLMQLFSDILDLSKIEAGTLVFNYKDVNFSDVVRSAASSTKFNAKESGTVNLVIDNMPECVIFTDSQRIQQVIINFITNAYKFTKIGSINVGYEIRDNNYVYCYVKDTGIGIDETQYERIFERFEKLDSFKAGTGLGLSICKMIIEKLHGEIGVKSVVNEGSTFWFLLPITTNTEKDTTFEK